MRNSHELIRNEFQILLAGEIKWSKCIGSFIYTFSSRYFDHYVFRLLLTLKKYAITIDGLFGQPFWSGHHSGVGWGGYSLKFYTGRPHPEVLPLTLLSTIFDRKVPLSLTVY